MTQENVEVIKRHVDATNQRDSDAFLATLSPDVEWEDAAFYSEPMRVYRGHQEVREWFERILVEPWESFGVEAEEFIPAGEDCVVVGGFVRGRGRGSGIETEIHGWMIFWITNGLVARRRVFQHRAEALEAAGVSE